MSLLLLPIFYIKGTKSPPLGRSSYSNFGRQDVSFVYTIPGKVNTSRFFSRFLAGKIFDLGRDS
eukprot:m.191819 g.191819  ORF g.191819 m.191819 type:complete len:64 (-) comp25723_c1_seq1:1808-1999(-)